MPEAHPPPLLPQAPEELLRVAVLQGGTPGEQLTQRHDEAHAPVLAGVALQGEGDNVEVGGGVVLLWLGVHLHFIHMFRPAVPHAAWSTLCHAYVTRPSAHDPSIRAHL